VAIVIKSKEKFLTKGKFWKIQSARLFLNNLIN